MQLSTPDTEIQVQKPVGDLVPCKMLVNVFFAILAHDIMQISVLAHFPDAFRPFCDIEIIHDIAVETVFYQRLAAGCARRNDRQPEVHGFQYHHAIYLII